MKLAVRNCPGADEEHEASRRQYAHVFHRAGTVCVAKAFHRLPQTHQLGILLHEAGHVIAGAKASETAANSAAAEASGVTIYYKDSGYGDWLEWIRPQDKRRAKEFLGI